MAYEITVKQLPGGYALEDATEGALAKVVFREFTSSEDGELFISRLDGWPTTIVSQLRPPAAVRVSEIDHLLAIIKQDRSATVYVNELPITARIRATRPIDAGAFVTENDIGDIHSVDLGVDIPTDAGVLLVISAKWRKGMFFDFGPLNGQGPRSYDVKELFSSYFAYLHNQALFSLSEDDWSYLISQNWFPFVGLPKRLLRTLLGRARNRSPLDLLVPQVRDAVKARLDTCINAWSGKPVFAAHIDLFRHAAARYSEGDFVSATAILYPRIEGLLRNIQAAVPQAKATQSGLSESVVRVGARPSHSWLMPAVFERYLKQSYFANFTPGVPAPISRNSVGHGVAESTEFSEKAAAIAFLIVEQIYWFLPAEQSVA